MKTLKLTASLSGYSLLGHCLFEHTVLLILSSFGDLEAPHLTGHIEGGLFGILRIVHALHQVFLSTSDMSTGPWLGKKTSYLALSLGLW